MKKVFLMLAVIDMTATSCSKYYENSLTNFYKEKCPGSKIVKKETGGYLVSLECAELYQTTAVKDLISKGVITYDLANGKLSAAVETEHDLPSMYKLLMSIAKGLKK